MKLSEYVIEFVAQQGVRHAFLVVGGGAMHLNEALGHSTIIPICNLHEQASAIGAENYSKATNHLGFALLTTGPGGTNAITGLAGAWLDSTPTLFVSGQVKRSDRMFHPDGSPMGVRQVGVQEVDIVSVVTPLTKYAVTVLDPLEIRYQMEKALYLASSDEKGIAEPTKLLADALSKSAPPGVRWHHEKMPEEMHSTIYHPAALKAFRAELKPPAEKKK